MLETISPDTLLPRLTPNFKHCRLDFGSYEQTNEEFAPSNSITARTIGRITLGPGSSQQAGYWFMSLDTGREILRRNWTPLQIPDV